MSDTERKALPIEDKESFKWFELTRSIRAEFDRVFEGATERPRLIHIFDREGDVHEVFDEILPNPAEGFVIRSSQDRSVLNEKGVACKARALATSSPLLGLHTVDVPRRKDQPARTATLQLRACKLTLNPLCPQHPERKALELCLVQASEAECPPGAAPLHWLLWTNEPAATFEQCCRVLDIYTKRWKIEDYHLTLKSGCGIEDLRLKTIEALEKALILYGLVAVRIMQLRDLARSAPDIPCTHVLSDVEWRVLQAQVKKRFPNPGEPAPTMRQAVLWIGKLGGHLGRKGDGMPGVRVLWKGLRDLELLVDQAKILLQHSDLLSPKP